MPEEYISREAALKAANEWVNEACMAPVMRVSRLLDKLAKVPAADVAPVVRCRDCIYNIDGLCFCRRPLGSGVAVEPDDFCRWGETE